MSKIHVIHSWLLVGVASAVVGSTALSQPALAQVAANDLSFQASDPGVRGGPAGAGGSLAGLADETDANLKISLRANRHVRDLPSLDIRASSDARPGDRAPCRAPPDLDHGKSDKA